MSVLTKTQANMMFRLTDKCLFETSLSPYDHKLDDKMAEVLEYFHCNEVYQLDLDDDYFRGIRANTFCIEVGWSEYYFEEKNGVSHHPMLYLITANHKGTRMLTMYAIEEGI